jgi:hypothetical protein
VQIPADPAGIARLLFSAALTRIEVKTHEYNSYTILGESTTNDYYDCRKLERRSFDSNLVHEYCHHLDSQLLHFPDPICFFLLLSDFSHRLERHACP